MLFRTMCHNPTLPISPVTCALQRRAPHRWQSSPAAPATARATAAATKLRTDLGEGGET
jgi:hypothetical protein